MITTLVRSATGNPTALLIAAAVVAIVVGVLAFLALRRIVRRVPAGTPWWYYLASVGGLAVSLNTSWRFFGERLAITGVERTIMFAVVELALIACALGMRANVRRVDPDTGRPGPAGTPRLVAWVLCGLSAYAALLLSGPVDGIARVALGPVLSLVMLHLALGIEIRHTTTHTTTWARVVGELRERALSRLGLADDARDALTRTRERAARRAARLVLSPRAPARAARLARALRTSGVAHDPSLRERMLAELAVLRHATALADVPLPSPWTVEPARTAAIGTPSPTAPADETATMPTATAPTVTVPADQPAPPTTPAPVTPSAPDASADAVANEPASAGTGRPAETRPDPAHATGNGAANTPAGRGTPQSGGPDRAALALVPPPSDATRADGSLDGVVLLTADPPEPWTDMTKNAAIDLADGLLPGRTARVLAVALAEVGITVAESSIRRRRSTRPNPSEEDVEPDDLADERELLPDSDQERAARGADAFATTSV